MLEEKIEADEVYKRSGAPDYEFPKYTTQLLNLANQNAQGTRARVVGQMSELIKECAPESFDEWKEWYLKDHPDSIEKATAKVMTHVENLRDAIDKIDEEMAEAWVKDLVLVKTAQGLLIQNAVFDYLSERTGLPYEPSSPADESKGIDGYLGGTAVSVKPHTYKSKTSTKHERIEAAMVRYRLTDKYLTVFYDEEDFPGRQEDLFD